MRKIKILWAVCCLAFFVFSCKSQKEKDAALTDSPIRGAITISADESFKPIVDELVKVYESNNAGTSIKVQYKPEADCVKDLWNDSIRMIISTYKLTEAARLELVDSLKIRVRQLPVARDAIAVIVNPAAKDSLFDMTDIKMILAGIYPQPLVPVFDGVKATSSVRYIVDSVLRGGPLAKSAVAASTSDSVIDYVARHKDAVGFIGVSWIGNPDDPQQLSFLKKVRIAHLESNDKKGKFVLPVQANIYTKRYPMTRDLVYILKEGHRGLGTGFSEFIAGEIGQLIFKRAYLMPGRKAFIIRKAQLKED
ncbi:MAG: substrate-binding domain-containing protein [Niabella sp.]